MILKKLPILVAILLCGCGRGGDEAARVTSPDGRHDAVVIEDGGGATTSFWYDICVVRVGETCSSKEIALVLYDAGRNASAYGVNIHWDGPYRVRAEYDTAERVQRMEPSPLIEAGVSIDIAPGTIDKTAPPGAMVRRDLPRTGNR
ncbi:hypothetical protein L2Y96_00440 [Luteibacter aegosomaticola]|uniref:hypothetical protein n=1 Tax=Luteibacter aegosomaticola TaxID=2911538 RepID=UPI001FFB8881|nr:hypothetical protein [Luteibacter aegosomaticola]UPG90272.1 hypothetical protein L2Y96_00440 [Luteibacter aegosomaticola]